MNFSEVFSSDLSVCVWEFVHMDLGCCFHCVHKELVCCVHMCPQLNILKIHPMEKQNSLLADILIVGLCVCVNIYGTKMQIHRWEV